MNKKNPSFCILNIDIKDKIPDILEAYTKVYGEEYRNLISERLNNIIYLFYNNLQGVSYYYNFLIDCKKKELAMKFLQNSNIDISSLIPSTYSESLSDELKDVIEKYIGSYEQIDNEKQIINKCKILGIDIKEYSKILEEYKKYIQEIFIYKDYINKELKRKNEILLKEKIELLNKIDDMLPINIKMHLYNNFNSLEERACALLTNTNDEKSYFNYFLPKYEDYLKNEKSKFELKDLIYKYRIKYLKSLKIPIGENCFNNNKEYYEYLMKQESIKELIMPINLIDKISEFEDKLMESAEKKFFYTSEEFLQSQKSINTPNFKKLYFDIYTRKMSCINNFQNSILLIPRLFFTVNPQDFGILDHKLLHEICHVIESHKLNENSYSVGFQVIGDAIEFNQYSKDKRKYERLNEFITEVFAIEALEHLHKKGIYILESPNIINDNIKVLDIYDRIELISKFVNKYRKPIIKARLLGNMEILYNTVGKENFEELNDYINKLDYLLTEFKEPFNDEELDIQYQEHVKKTYQKVYEVYSNMESYNQKSLEYEERF